MAKQKKMWRDIAEILTDKAEEEATGNPACPVCGAIMARSWVNPHAWVCIEQVSMRPADEVCPGNAADCTDCGKPVFQKACRCAAGCDRIVCDDCYLTHCEDGCTKKATYGKVA